MISIYTQVYNTKKYLPQCIESVLNQTWTDFEYILIDNGSNDGCKEILEEYEAKDKRITLIRFEKNRIDPIWLKIAREVGVGRYITELDSDDWLEPTFLERMVSLAEQQQLDIVCTGTAFHLEGQENIVSGTRSLPQQVIMERPQYAAYFPCYHAFFRTVWGKLIRRNVFMSADLSIIDREEITNGADTLSAFAWLRQAKRVCIDNSVLHHYLMRKKSVSRIYLPNRFKSNTVLNQDAMDFLSQYGPVSKQNRHFLHIVYANAVFDTLEVLWNSDLSPEEKLAEYCVIATHPTTQESYQDTDSAIDRSRNTLRKQLLSVSWEAPKEPGNFSEALQFLFPKCGRVLTWDAMTLFQREPRLTDALMQDDPDRLSEGLLDLIVAKRYIKRYNLGQMLRALAADNLFLCGIDDLQFLRKYRTVYWTVWQGNLINALDEMTGMLLENRVRGAEGIFLQLYLSVAARLEQIPAFIFGKIRLAQFYLQKHRTAECKAILDELEEMGVQDNCELAELRRQLEVVLDKF